MRICLTAPLHTCVATTRTTDDKRGPLAPCDALLTLPPNPVNGFLTAALPRGPKSEAPAAKVVYRTVLTLARRLEKNGYVRHKARGKAHVYLPAAKRDEVVRRSVRDLVDRLFGGDAGSLVQFLAEEGKLRADKYLYCSNISRMRTLLLVLGQLACSHCSSSRRSAHYGTWTPSRGVGPGTGIGQGIHDLQ